MHILIKDEIVVGLSQDAFDVHPDFQWIEHDVEVPYGSTYRDGVFIPPSEPEPTEPTEEPV